jgi:hypothetical protein
VLLKKFDPQALEALGGRTMSDSNQQSTKSPRQWNNDGVASDGASPRVGNTISPATSQETVVLDDQGTTQEEAVELLQILHEEVFDSNDEQLALALGRSTEEVKAWLNGTQTVDTDVLIKARALIIERGDLPGNQDEDSNDQDLDL